MTTTCTEAADEPNRNSVGGVIGVQTGPWRLGFTVALVMIGGRSGMFVVETIARIRRACFVQGKSIKSICRELRVSRKIVRKVLRSDATEFRYERKAQPLPRIDPWRADLDRLLASNEAKPRRERLTLIRVFESLRALG